MKDDNLRVAKDELNALLALGVIASIVALFQINENGLISNMLNLPPVTPLELSLERLAEELTLALFGGYIVLMTLSLGFERFDAFQLVTKYLRRASDVSFLWGAWSLLLLGFVYAIRIF